MQLKALLRHITAQGVVQFTVCKSQHSCYMHTRKQTSHFLVSEIQLHENSFKSEGYQKLKTHILSFINGQIVNQHERGASVYDSKAAKTSQVLSFSYSFFVLLLFCGAKHSSTEPIINGITGPHAPQLNMIDG